MTFSFNILESLRCCLSLSIQLATCHLVSRKTISYHYLAHSRIFLLLRCPDLSDLLHKSCYTNFKACPINMGRVFHSSLKFNQAYQPKICLTVAATYSKKFINKYNSHVSNLLWVSIMALFSMGNWHLTDFQKVKMGHLCLDILHHDSGHEAAFVSL